MPFPSLVYKRFVAVVGSGPCNKVTDHAYITRDIMYRITGTSRKIRHYDNVSYFTSGIKINQIDVPASRYRVPDNMPVQSIFLYKPKRDISIMILDCLCLITLVGIRICRATSAKVVLPSTDGNREISFQSAVVNNILVFQFSENNALALLHIKDKDGNKP